MAAAFSVGVPVCGCASHLRTGACRMPLINAVVVLRHRSTSRRIALMTLPYVVVFAAYLGAIAAVRSGQVYPGISFGSVEGFGRSFLVHRVGAVPFSYWLFDPKGVFGIGLFQPTDAILIGGMAVWT